MFFRQQIQQEQEKYVDLLRVVGALSKLSSDSEIPYLYYRMAENIFCKAFDAENLARSDISLDAKKGQIGLGLKTFICKGVCSTEKIAEFNESRHLIDEADTVRKKVNTIASLRNERLETTGGICDILIENMLYHCVARRAGKFLFHETPIKKINIENIGAIRENGNIISFSDGIYDYSFNGSRYLRRPVCNIGATHRPTTTWLDTGTRSTRNYCVAFIFRAWRKTCPRKKWLKSMERSRKSKRL